MSELDDALRAPDNVPQHPVVIWLSERRKAGDEIKVAVQNDSSPLGSSVPDLIVLRSEKGVEQPPQVYRWDDDLNSAMIKLGIRATDVEQEGERFALVLRTALRKVERRYGDGYMNAVLIDLIDDSSLGKDGEIGKIRRLIHSASPQRTSQAYTDCRDAIALEIGHRAKELRSLLEYGPTDLEAVMDKAIAHYLDSRFSITMMRNFGWIDENGRTTK